MHSIHCYNYLCYRHRLSFLTRVCHHYLSMDSSKQKPKVLVTRSDFTEEATALLQERFEVEQYALNDTMPRDKLLHSIKGKHAILLQVTEKVDAEVLDSAGQNLKCISTVSVGYDHINIPECKKRGIVVGHTPNVLTNAMAEMTIGLLLGVARRISEANYEVRRGGWTKPIMPRGWLFGVEIANSIIGIVGFGRIGQAVVKRLKAFQPAKIVYYGIVPVPAATDAEFESFDTLLKVSDFIIVCCSLTNDTKEMFDEAAFKRMKSNAIFINISRGGVVKQDALYNALVTGKIRAAGLDVMTPEPLPVNHPLTKLNNCILTPHIGASTYSCRKKMELLAVENITAALTGQTLPSHIQ